MLCVFSVLVAFIAFIVLRAYFHEYLVHGWTTHLNALLVALDLPVNGAQQQPHDDRLEKLHKRGQRRPDCVEEGARGQQSKLLEER